uniref:Putative secreted protein n=1 Tax=Ixodes ricinus TaxID=34613 RepID=A0A6B0UM67_IXORI
MLRWLKVIVTSEVRVVAAVLLRGLAGSAHQMRGRLVHCVPPSLSVHTNCQAREILPLFKHWEKYHNAECGLSKVHTSYARQIPRYFHRESSHVGQSLDPLGRSNFEDGKAAEVLD